MMERSMTRSPRDETMKRIYEQRANLITQIERLQEQADSAQGGIRLYRNHRVDQFRERERDLTSRLGRIESGSAEATFDNEAQDLIADLVETATLAEHTFHQIMRV